MQLDIDLRQIILFYSECLTMLQAAGGRALQRARGQHGFDRRQARRAWNSVYSATKAGVVGLDGVDEQELGSLGIKSTALCPAFVDTPMTDFVKEHVKAEDMITPQDIAEAVRYLSRLSPAAWSRRSCSCDRRPGISAPPQASQRMHPVGPLRTHRRFERPRACDGLACSARPRLQVDPSLIFEARLQLRDEHPQLALARSRGSAPAPAKRSHAFANESKLVRPAVAVGGHHRAYAALAVHVSADDDPFARDRLEHRFARADAAGSRSCGAGPDQTLGWRGDGSYSHRLCAPAGSERLRPGRGKRRARCRIRQRIPFR